MKVSPAKPAVIGRSEDFLLIDIYLQNINNLTLNVNFAIKSIKINEVLIDIPAIVLKEQLLDMHQFFWKKNIIQKILKAAAG